MFITIKYKSNSTVLPLGNVLSTDLAMLFSVKLHGMHLKININDDWQNIWPENGQFKLPSVNEAFLIAADESTGVTAMNITTTAPSTVWSGRGNNVSFSVGTHTQSVAGPRAVPSTKRCTPAPLKKKLKMDSCYKIISISDITSETVPESIYDVPIDLNKLDRLNTNFGIIEVQREIGNQVNVPGQTFILTNKKGHPIRDMENTRGIYTVCNKLS